jgi:hypothetical protein
MPTPDARARRAASAALLVLFALLVSLRMPEIWIKGRFWAEEGNSFLYHAAVSSWPAALFWSFGGYLNLAANAAALLAWHLPLALAPYLTITTGLLAQLVPPLILLTARDAWLQPLPIRALALALILLIPGSEETWLQTLHVQFHLTLAAALILGLDTAGPRWLRRAILVLAPLCGPGAIALVPLFALRALLDRSRERTWQTAALTAAAALQLGLFYVPQPRRELGIHPVLYSASLFVKHVALPYLGLRPAQKAGTALAAALAHDRIPRLACLATLAYFAAFLATAIRAQSRTALSFLAAGLALALIGLAGGLGSPADKLSYLAGARYAFVPQALFGLALLALATTPGPRTRLLFLPIAWLLTLGALNYPNPWPYIADGPAWRREVALWHQDPGHLLRLWPPGWTVGLPQPPRAP